VLGRAPAPEPEPIDPPKPTRSSAPVATRQWTNQIVLTPDDNTVPDQRTLEHSAIGVTTIEGPQGPGFQGAPDPGPAATAPAPAPIEPAPVVEELPSAPPSFPGGMKAWTEFLVRNLIPSSDMQPGEKRSVLVRFWVDEDGAVGRFEIMQSGGHGFDNEVLRVLRKMPRWKPALQRGRAVATSFVQPVTFQAPEE
ncbi:MAG: energy transducer TonB, partial [Chitinophagaceae bacterium]